MTLADYLAETGQSEGEFAKRSGIARSTIYSICRGGGAHVDTAAQIVRATGGLVSYEDLRSSDARECG